MKMNTKTIVGMGILTAVVVVLQALAISIRFGVFSISLVLAPIIIGAALYGVWAGGWLGLVFAIMVLATGDAAAFLAINIPGTIITVFAKGICAGLLAGVVYKALEKKNRTAAVVCAGIAAPVTNTGLFLIGCALFFLPTVRAWGEAAGFTNVGVYMLTGFVGLNFIVELAINLVLASVIVRIIQIALRSSESSFA